MVDNTTSLQMYFFVCVCEVVWVLGELILVPERVEIGFGQGFHCWVYDLDGGWISTSDFVRSDTDQGTVFVVQSALDTFHVTS